MLARLAALIAVDAPPASYLANADAAEKSGITADDIQEVMIAIAPIVGTARVVSAAGKILRAMGLDIAVVTPIWRTTATCHSRRCRPDAGDRDDPNER